MAVRIAGLVELTGVVEALAAAELHEERQGNVVRSADLAVVLCVHAMRTVSGVPGTGAIACQPAGAGGTVELERFPNEQAVPEREDLLLLLAVADRSEERRVGK